MGKRQKRKNKKKQPLETIEKVVTLIIDLGTLIVELGTLICLIYATFFK